MYSHKASSEEQVGNLHAPFWSADLNLQPSCEVSILLILLHLLLSIAQAWSFTDLFHVGFRLSFRVSLVQYCQNFDVQRIFRATCLGPGKLSLQYLNIPEYVASICRNETTDSSLRRTFLLKLHRVFDIRASHLQNQTLVLGN